MKARIITKEGKQFICLPEQAMFSAGTTEVEVRVNGQERVVSPVSERWDSFFLSTNTVSEDFLLERPSHDGEDRVEF